MTFYEIWIWFTVRKLWWVSQVTCLRYNSGACKNHNFLGSYLPKYSKKISQTKIQGSLRVCLKWVLISSSEMSYKKCYSANSTMICLEQWNPRIQSFDTKCYATSSKIDRSTTYKLSSSRDKPPLHYINEQFLDDTNDKTSLVYIGV